MNEDHREYYHKVLRIWLFVLLAVIVAVLAWRIFFGIPVPGLDEDKVNKVLQPPQKPEVMADVNKPAAKDRMAEIVKGARSWEPAFNEWIGKKAPEIDLYDVDGKAHKLSNYKGKEVILVFWATWCGPCKQEIPGLIDLRKTISEDKLAIMAISFEQGSTVKPFLSQVPVNYIVMAAPQETVPEPYNQIESIPAGFFIDKEGIIRLATVGMVSEDEMKTILDAMD